MDIEDPRKKMNREIREVLIEYGDTQVEKALEVIDKVMDKYEERLEALLESYIEMMKKRLSSDRKKGDSKVDVEEIDRILRDILERPPTGVI